VTDVARYRIGIKTSQQDTDWPTLDADWARIGEHDVFDSVWLNDHLNNTRDPVGGPSFEAVTLLAALAHRVPGKTLGIGVLSTTFRHPSVLAKQLTVLDHVTGGRLIAGLGAGWHEPEHTPFGIPFPPMPERFDQFDSSYAVIRAFFSDEARALPGVTRPDPYFPLQNATNEPGTLSPHGPTVWLGGQKRRGIDLAARYAQGWIIPFLLPDGRTDRVPYFAERRTLLLERMSAIGRDPAGFEFATQIPTGSTPDAWAETLDLAHGFVHVGASQVILSMPPNLGRDGVDSIASVIAEPLRAALR
jgi:alkanesulfonate monooxygenase SsuD/methylene tetrahydromethanopterin reductase-like flavin-dependent oxidoreductase (luciferase family)